MKKAYSKPEADKISFNYRDQVVAASSGPGDGSGTGNNGGWFENIMGAGATACGVVDFLFDLGNFCS